MASITVTKAPDEYPKQRKKQCGAYVLKALLQMYGKDGDDQPQAYLSLMGRLFFGFTGPWRMRKVLRSHGLEADFSWAKTPKEERLEPLKRALREDAPVIALIANPYKSSLRHNRLRQLVNLHWVLLLGYDDDKEEFYLYDPHVALAKHAKGLPTGNLALPAKKFRRLWRGSFLSRFLTYFYMAVREKKINK